ncbi:MAG: N-acetylglucosamine-6-phosphate deacetylase [Candidatus Ancaeobacter aquaticus]|nr:N-acetylglucosamine-6-phosphate deacetylase [Candidatus Ancaeobacter aquaticus]
MRCFIKNAANVVLYGDVLTEKGLCKNSFIVTTNNRIVSISSRKPSQKTISESKWYNCSGKMILPGFIDTHVHGIGEYDVSLGGYENAILMGKHMAKHGVTGFLYTFCTMREAVLIENIKKVAVASKQKTNDGARILGIHLEGPFINKMKAGAQNVRDIKKPHLVSMQKYVECSQGLIKIVTLAPEVNGADILIRYLRKNHIVPGCGHSSVTYEDARKAIKNGVCYATHLGNAMTTIHHRYPGAVGAFLLDKDAYVEIIPDGVHLHPAFIKLVMGVKEIDKVIGVTDSLQGISDKCTSFMFGGKKTYKLKDRYAHKNGTLAGSSLTMDNALRNIINFTGKDVSNSVKLITINPAKALGIEKKKGSLAVGKDADIVVVDKKFNVQLTMVEGRTVYKK